VISFSGLATTQLAIKCATLFHIIAVVDFTLFYSKPGKSSEELQNLPLHLNCFFTVPGKTLNNIKQHILKSVITNCLGTTFVVCNFN